MNLGKKVIIVGGGPAGLFCAERLLNSGFEVDLYDHQTGTGKKFLVAGNGGLNLTHSDNLKCFAAKYGKDESRFYRLIKEFSPQDLRDWCNDIGVETFIGTSGRVFPNGLKAAEILIKWMSILKSSKRFKLNLNHKFVSIDHNKVITFFKNNKEKIKLEGDIIVFALGGASWKKTGSNGDWLQVFKDLKIKCNPFLPMNCGFEAKWSDYFRTHVNRHPLKNIELHFMHHKIRTEIMITDFGVEGTGIYALSNYIRDEILKNKKVSVFIDLLPDHSIESITEKIINKKSKISLSNFFRKNYGLRKPEFTLMRELIEESCFNDPLLLATHIKKLEIKLANMRSIDEAISTSGGVCFSELTNSLELKAIPGVFIVGEMLDFEAPTGGYLLQGCFSSAFTVIKQIKKVSR